MGGSKGGLAFGFLGTAWQVLEGEFAARGPSLAIGGTMSAFKHKGNMVRATWGSSVAWIRNLFRNRYWETTKGPHFAVAGKTLCLVRVHYPLQTPSKSAVVF